MERKSRIQPVTLKFAKERQRLEQETLLESVIAGDPDSAFDDDVDLSQNNQDVLQDIVESDNLDQLIESLISAIPALEAFIDKLPEELIKLLGKKFIDIDGDTQISLEDLLSGKEFKDELKEALSGQGVGGAESIKGAATNATKDIKRSIKKVIIYEAHKRINPKRLAGETKLRNFVNNMIVGGFQRANKYEGKRTGRLAGYYQNFVKRSENKAPSLMR